MSSQHFNRLFPSSSFHIEDRNAFHSLDSAKKMFISFLTNPPTFEEAIKEAKFQDLDSILSLSREFARIAKSMPEIACQGLTDDEAAAISCYTLELSGDCSPYEILNGCLSGGRDTRALLKTRKFIFLFLSGLRKLSKYIPSTGQQFYRGLRARVPTEANGHQVYTKNSIVTLWGFTSTTANFDAINVFIKGAAEITLFIFGGKDLWGYNIQAFSPYDDEAEILLEPEAVVKVSGVVETGRSLSVNVEFQPFVHLVLESVIPVSDSTAAALPVPRAASVERLEPKCVWKECPGNKNWYLLDERNPRIATKNSCYGYYCTVIGNTPLPLNKVTSWNIKILKSEDNDGKNIYIGVAFSNIDQLETGHNYNKRGWYFHCYTSTLHSGPPHCYKGKVYGPRKEVNGNYACEGEIVGVVMDTAKGELSFVLNGVNLGVAFEKVPTSLPLVPCVLLEARRDSVELIV